MNKDPFRERSDEEDHRDDDNFSEVSLSVSDGSVSTPDTSLHECVFNGNANKLCTLAMRKKIDIDQQDKHGNTPLHLACMLGRKELIHRLLAYGASPTVRNRSGWSPLTEAISYGDRQIISSVLWRVNKHCQNRRDSFMPKLAKVLSGMDDFYMEFKWDFQSWVPLVSRILPSDVCRLRKKGSNIRLDTTLVDFDDMRWVRGDMSILFFGEGKPSRSLAFLDNKLKIYQWLQYEENEKDFEDEVDLLMSTDIVNAHISTKNMSFTRLQKGWLFKEDKKEMVGKFQADFYTIHGISLETNKRREHLSKEDLQKNKMLYEMFMKEGKPPPDESNGPPRRKSLSPPPPCSTTWSEYMSADPGHHPVLGRPLLLKERSKGYKATIAMSPDFPMTVEMLLNVLQAISSLKHFSRLLDVVRVKLPPGFPVQIDIPIIPTISAKVTFLEFEFKNDLLDDDFIIPSHYVEEKGRFPGL